MLASMAECEQLRKFLLAKVVLFTQSANCFKDNFKNSSEIVFSPSRRTVSSLVTDCQSEHDGLRVFINRTERKFLMRQTRAIDEANANV